METTTSAFDISNYFIELASGVDENDLTNLKLQKLLYYAQGLYLAKKDTKLFKESIEAWDLGPVVRDVYVKFKSCGAFPINTFDVDYESKALEASLKDFLKDVWEKYAIFSAGYLVKDTHKAGSPWTKHYSKETKKEIPVSDIQSYFQVAKNSL